MSIEVHRCLFMTILLILNCVSRTAFDADSALSAFGIINGGEVIFNLDSTRRALLFADFTANTADLADRLCDFTDSG